ncbi:hypothetical protein MPTK1_1g09590 [Marchantia polymorpha subsp. ruderalis]|uniref:Uncharacterized protein n=2 Tax=Marchantia polymorpha TaxID=3197 RepID=A0AAF6ANB5_MARPO|nr:hypothetical protein MARPO_0096s0041 [Marchantia polymorpha]BBM97935.1 hypothetical protein Mp_1g09590 [Marchantia polymorpha subsp. ruderalis]|eukprot:PTQ32694.1 hypothetical protein MARPO_0096s0041 [Marchantia polymorpha]
MDESSLDVADPLHQSILQLYDSTQSFSELKTRTSLHELGALRILSIRLDLVRCFFFSRIAVRRAYRVVGIRGSGSMSIDFGKNCSTCKLLVDSWEAN